jgi:hypothetical protein
MRRDFQIAIILAVAAIPAGVALMAAPEYLHLTGTSLALTFWGGIVLTVLLIVAAVILALRGEAQTPSEGRRNRMIAIVGMAACGLGFIGFTIWFFSQRPGYENLASAVGIKTDGREPEAPQSLAQLFKTDFERTLRTNSELTLTSPQDATITDKVLIQIYNDMDTGTYFVGFYVPMSPRTPEIIRYLTDGYLSPTLQLRQGVEITSRDPADTTPLKFSDFSFSRRIYVYHESDLSIQDIAALDTMYRNKNLILQLRGRQYQTTRWLQKSAIKK